MHEMPSAAAVDVAALARQPGPVRPLLAWQPWRLLRSLWRLFGARWRGLVGGLLASAGRALVLVAASLAVGRAVGMGGVASWGVAAAVGLLAAAALGYLGQRLVVDAVQDGLSRLRHRLVDRQLALPVEVVGERGAAPFVLALTRDGELLGQMARACFAGLLPAALLVLLCLAGLLLLMPQLALALLAGGALLWLVRRRLAARLAQQMRRAHADLDSLYAQLGGMALRHELAVSHANESRERAAASARVEAARAATRALAITQAGVSELDAALLGLGLLGVVSWLAAAGQAVSAAQLATLAFLLLALRSALQAVLRSLQEMAQGVPALEAIEALLALPAMPAHHGRELPTRWAVSLQGVSCSVGGVAALSGVDLALAPGRIAVLTGANGAGKTTLLRVLLGLLPPDAGTLLVDGRPWSKVDRTAFRRGVAYLPQNIVLFPGSVLDNLGYAADEISPLAARTMLQSLGLAGRLGPQGLAMPLGPGGSPLSGGERQRLALARALLRGARLIILDEPTNHLDGLTAAGLVDLLRQLPRAPAVLIVSHDPTLQSRADVCWRLEAGRLVPG